MSTFVSGAGLSYLDYLKAKKLRGDPTAEVSAQSRTLAASDFQLGQAGITVRETITNASGVKTDVLLYGMDRKLQPARELNSTFRWDFAEPLAFAGRMGDSTKESASASGNPVRARIYKQYEKAREKVREHHYAEALEELQAGISEFMEVTGYKPDFRILSLLGIIRLGSVYNTGDEVIDLAEAEQAFLDAAKNASTGYPAEAARAYLAAGHAAYCRGKLEDARHWTDEAISLNGELAEAHFQKGKLFAHAGDIDAALCHLRAAMLLDPLYALRALDDGDYQKRSGPVSEFLVELHKRARVAVESNLEEAKQQYTQLKAATFGGRDFEKCMGKKYRLGESLTKATDAFKHGSYPDYLECARWLRDVVSKLSCARGEYFQLIEESVLSKPDDGEKELARVRDAKTPTGLQELRIWGIVILVVIGFAMKPNGPLIVLLGAPILWFGVGALNSLVKASRIQALRSSAEARIARWKRLKSEYPLFRITLAGSSGPLSAMSPDKLASRLLKISS
jgi:tetratricopeptide (TPR) repeat protein